MIRPQICFCHLIATSLDTPPSVVTLRPEGFLFLGAFRSPPWRCSATHSVGANESIQAAIDGASSGDQIVLTYPGQYVGNFSVSGKSLIIRALNSQFTNVLGNASVSNMPNGGKVRFIGFSISGSVQAQGRGGILLQSMNVNTNVDLNGTTDGFLKRTTVTGLLNFPNKLDGDDSPTRLVVLQSTIREKLTSRATKAWLGYSTLEETYLEGTLEIVGNVFDGRRFGGIGIDLNGTATHASIHNNRIHRFDDYSATVQDATESRIVVTGNYRAWRHFIAMRASEHADVEIRRLAITCLRQLIDLLQRDPVVAMNDRIRPQLSNELNEVVGEGIVVVDHENHDEPSPCVPAERSSARRIAS